MDYQRNLPEIIPLDILFSSPLQYNPQISPNGKILAYLAPVNNVVNIWIRNIDKKDDRAITFFEKRSVDRYFWATDKYIIYLYDMEGNGNRGIYRLTIETGENNLLTPRNLQLRFIPHNKNIPDELIVGISKDNKTIFDLYRLDIPSGILTLVYKNSGKIVDYMIDNRNQLWGKTEIRDDGGMDFFIRDDDNDNWKKLISWDIEDSSLSRPFCLTSDNNYIYFIDSHVNTTCLVKMEIKTGKREIIFHHPEYDINCFSFNDGRTMDLIDNLLMHPDNCEVQAVAYNKSRREWFILDETIRNDFEVIKKLDYGDIHILSRSDSDELWIIAFEKDNGPIAYYIFNRIIKEGKLLFEDRPSLNNYRLARMEEMSFTSRDGLTIHGYITYPPESERKNLPLVLYVHRGPWIRDSWGYNPEVQWFANRGYICLQINYRGSTGYGKNFANSGNKEWGGKMQDDLTDSVKWAVNEGIADPQRIAIYGAGYGGYASLAGVAFTPELFSCAVAIDCPANLITFINSIPSHPYKKRIIKKIGDPHFERDLLISRSPFYKSEYIRTPLLIAHSLKNYKIRSTESYEIVRNMKSKGIDVEYIVFPDEGYFFNKQKNRIKFHALVEKFLGKCLGGRTETIEISQKDIYIGKSPDKLNHKKLIDKILREGDRIAFEKLQKRYEKPLMKYINKMTGDFDLSKELLQETFLNLWLYLDTYKYQSSFSTWLFSIAINVVRKHRMMDIEPYNKINIDEIDNDLIIQGWEKGVEDKLSFQSIMTSLKEPYKTAVNLRFVEHMDYKTIASIMNTNENQIKAYLFRARQYLQKSMKKENPL